MSDYFLKCKKEWSELESLLIKGRKRFRRLSARDIERLDLLYRRTTIHLAQVQTRMRDPKLAEYLNSLVIAAHSYIYTPPRKSAASKFGLFLKEGFSRAVIRTGRYHLASALLMILGIAIGYFSGMNDVRVIYAVMPVMEQRLPGTPREELMEYLHSGRDTGGGEKTFFASFLFTHNFKVGVLALSAGALAAIPTIFLMFYNGLILGAFTAMHHRVDIYADYWAWILPHGVTELFAIVLCGGIGLQLGVAVVRAGRMSRNCNMRRVGLEAGRVCLGVGVMLFIAALIESFLRQSHLSNASRFLFTAAISVAWFLYFLLGFIREQQAKSAAFTAGSACVYPDTDSAISD